MQKTKDFLQPFYSISGIYIKKLEIKKKKKKKKMSLIAYVHYFYYKNQYILYEPHDS